MSATRGWLRARSCALAVRLDELVLDDPVDLAVELHRVALDRGHAVLPHLQRLRLERRQALGVGVADGPVEVLALDVERRHLAPVVETHRAAARHVVADLADGPDGVLERHVAQHDRRVLEHAQQDRRGPDLQERRVLAHVRVADDHVQAPVALGVGVGLVTRVDDRAAARGGAAHALPDVLGALGDAVHGAPGRLQHLAGAGVDLTATRRTG